MKAKTFYPEIILKIKEINFDNMTLKAVNDMGEEVNVSLMNKNQKSSQEEFIKFIQKKAEKAINKTIIDAITDKLNNNDSLMEEIEQKILKENPEIIKKPKNFLKAVIDKTRETAEQIAKDMYMLDKGMIIKVGGITDSTGKNITVKLNFDLSNNKNPGYYILSVPNKKNILFEKIPVKLIPTNNNSLRVFINTSIAEEEEIKDVLRMFLKTLKAHYDGKIKAKPTIYFSTYNPDKKLKHILNKFNESLNYEKIQYQEIARKLKDIVLFLSENRAFNCVNISMPLEPLKLNIENIINETKEKLIRTAFRNDLQNANLNLSDIDQIIQNSLFNNDKKIVFQTFYKLKTDNNRYGFFPESVQRNLVPSSFIYDRIITEKEKFIKEKRKKFEEKKKNIEFKNTKNF